MQILLPFILIFLCLNESILDKDPISPLKQIEFRELVTNQKNPHFLAKLFAFRKMTKNQTNANQADLNSRKSTCATSKKPLTLQHLKKVCGLRKDDKSFDSYNYTDFKKTAKIVRGKSSKLGEWPWHAYLLSPGAGPTDYQICGGALITDDVILTAAHCLPYYKEQASGIMIMLGAVSKSNYKKTYWAKDFEKHENYNFQSNVNDIGLIWLSEKVKFNCYIAPICLPFPTAPFLKDKLDQVKAWLAGYGKLKMSDIKTPNQMQQVEVKLLSNEKCSKYYGESILANQICATGEGKGSCAGDSGGSYMIRYKGQWTSVALVSYTGTYECAVMPTVCPRVTSYESWIKTKVDLFNDDKSSTGALSKE